MELNTVIKNLEAKGYIVTVCDTAEEAAAYLNEKIVGKTVGFGGSQTLNEMNVRNTLAEKNTVVVPDFHPAEETFEECAMRAIATDIFLMSSNAVSENGELVNIDGIGNRLAGALFGHEKIYYVIGENKIGGSLEDAIWRARNIAAPKNAIRLYMKTPCALAVKDELEKKFRETYGVEGPIDDMEWETFVAHLDVKDLHTHCYDCKSADRICKSMQIHMAKPDSMEAEVVIIRKTMGF